MPTNTRHPARAEDMRILGDGEFKHTDSSRSRHAPSRTRQETHAPPSGKPEGRRQARERSATMCCNAETRLGV